MIKEQQMEALWPFLSDTNLRDSDGSIMPWYTHDALRWIKLNIPKYLSVLEFGGGHSSLWWLKRTIELMTIEFNKDACRILGINPSSPLQFFNSKQDLLKHFDIVIVDSEAELPRQEYIIRAFDLATKYLIVDNFQQPDVCMYSDEIVKYLKENSKEVHIFNQPNHRDGSWKTAIFVK